MLVEFGSPRGHVAASRLCPRYRSKDGSRLLSARAAVQCPRSLCHGSLCGLAVDADGVGEGPTAFLGPQQSLSYPQSSGFAGVGGVLGGGRGER
jgi:hypothetical protein